jgi:hypothetical protein
MSRPAPFLKRNEEKKRNTQLLVYDLFHGDLQFAGRKIVGLNYIQAAAVLPPPSPSSFTNLTLLLVLLPSLLSRWAMMRRRSRVRHELAG